MNDHHAPADIVVVDDDPLVTTSLCRLLELETPHRVHCFSSSAAALAAIEAHPPELVISDLAMPGMDGIELLRRARAIRPDGARLILTGYADKDSAIRAINQAGIYSFVEKPWDNEQLLITVGNALEHVSLTRQVGQMIGQLTARNAELEHALAELHDAQDRLVSAERLAAVGRLASGITHEIGNQLSLLGFVDLIAERTAGDPDMTELIEPLIAARRRLASMVASIRDYVRGAGKVTYEREPQPVTAIADEALDILRFEPVIKLRQVRRAPYDRHAVADVNREKLLQVLINLIRNALQATEENGVVRVGVHQAGEQVIIEVADDGHGIAPEHLEKIWEPFFSTKGEIGTGLGLGISRRILEEHGGTIDVRSAPGEGATFTITLPAGVVEHQGPKTPSREGASGPDPNP